MKGVEPRLADRLELTFEEVKDLKEVTSLREWIECESDETRKMAWENFVTRTKVGFPKKISRCAGIDLCALQERQAERAREKELKRPKEPRDYSGEPERRERSNKRERSERDDEQHPHRDRERDREHDKDRESGRDRGETRRKDERRSTRRSGAVEQEEVAAPAGAPTAPAAAPTAPAAATSKPQEPSRSSRRKREADDSSASVKVSRSDRLSFLLIEVADPIFILFTTTATSHFRSGG